MKSKWANQGSRRSGRQLYFRVRVVTLLPGPCSAVLSVQCSAWVIKGPPAGASAQPPLSESRPCCCLGPEAVLGSIQAGGILGVRKLSSLCDTGSTYVSTGALLCVGNGCQVQPVTVRPASCPGPAQRAIIWWEAEEEPEHRFQGGISPHLGGHLGRSNI